MADRLDPSQFVFTAGPQDGTAALPDTTMHNDQIQQTPEGDYAEPLELISYPDHADVPDLLHQHPGRFFTQAPARTTPVVRYRPVSPAGGAAIPGAFKLAGFNFRETAGAAAIIRLRDGYDVGASIVVSVSLAASESTRDFLPIGLKFKYGMFVEVVSGAIEGAVYTLEADIVQ